METKSVNTSEAKTRRHKSTTPRTQLERKDWIELAIDTLAKEGIGGPVEDISDRTAHVDHIRDLRPPGGLSVETKVLWFDHLADTQNH